MKQFLGIISLLTITLFINSCNEDVNLTGDFQETAVVHGLLDQADSVHFIKINRAFIGPGNSYTIAQEMDSNYFQNIDVKVTEVLNGSDGRFWNLVDTLVENKDQNGVFYAPTEILYYFHTINQSPLNPAATYRLDISINGGALKIQGETKLVSGITSPTSSQNFTFKFANTQQEYISTGVTASSVGNSYVINSSLEININEYIGGVATPKTINWNLGESEVVPFDDKTFSANGASFYSQIASKVTNDPLIDRRTFESITVVFTGGAEDLYNYMSVNKPSSGLAQNKPTYTNLSVSGEGRVIGIFSSRQTVRYKKPFYIPAQAYIRSIDKNSTRYLCTKNPTGPLLFCSQHPADDGDGFDCQ